MTDEEISLYGLAAVVLVLGALGGYALWRRGHRSLAVALWSVLGGVLAACGLRGLARRAERREARADGEAARRLAEAHVRDRDEHAELARREHEAGEAADARLRELGGRPAAPLAEDVARLVEEWRERQRAERPPSDPHE